MQDGGTVYMEMVLCKMEVQYTWKWSYARWRYSIHGNGPMQDGGTVYMEMVLCKMEVQYTWKWSYARWRYSIHGNGPMQDGGTVYMEMVLCKMEVQYTWKWSYARWRYSIHGNGPMQDGGTVYMEMVLCKMEVQYTWKWAQRGLARYRQLGYFCYLMRRIKTCARAVMTGTPFSSGLIHERVPVDEVCKAFMFMQGHPRKLLFQAFIF